MGESGKYHNRFAGKRRKQMIIKGDFPFLTEKKHVISLVGAGGKTTLMYALARQFTENGARTVVATTTHICRPEGNLWAKNPQEVIRLWERGSYAVVGVPCEDGKLKGLPEQELDSYIRMADIVLVEADGAKRMPCKVPAGHEPVIPGSCDIVIGVMGMDALGQPLDQVCFRKSEAARLLNMGLHDVLTADRMAKILASRDGTRKDVGKREYYVVLNKCDSKEHILAGEQIMGILREQGIVRCVLTCFMDKKRCADE